MADLPGIIHRSDLADDVVATPDDAGLIQLTQDLDGTADAPLVVGLQGVAISNTAPTTDQVLTFNGSIWIPSPAVDSNAFFARLITAGGTIVVDNDGNVIFTLA